MTVCCPCCRGAGRRWVKNFIQVCRVCKGKGRLSAAEEEKA